MWRHSKADVLRAWPAAAIGALFAFPSAPAFAKTVSECNAEYAANKAAIRASKQTKKDFVAACRAGTETIPTAAAPAALAPRSSRASTRRTAGSRSGCSTAAGAYMCEADAKAASDRAAKNEKHP